MTGEARTMTTNDVSSHLDDVGRHCANIPNYTANAT